MMMMMMTTIFFPSKIEMKTYKQSNKKQQHRSKNWNVFRFRIYNMCLRVYTFLKWKKNLTFLIRIASHMAETFFLFCFLYDHANDEMFIIKRIAIYMMMTLTQFFFDVILAVILQSFVEWFKSPYTQTHDES